MSIRSTSAWSMNASKRTRPPSMVSQKIIKLGRGGRCGVRDGWGVLERTAVLEVGGDPGGSERVAAGGIGQGSRFGPPFDHLEDVEARHQRAHKLVPLVHAAEQPALIVTPDASGLDVGVQVALKAWMAGHFVPLATFLVQPQHQPLTVLVNGPVPHAPP